ncbi:hypothetical protein CHARACLAT_027263 [Characodon lateralis]|uniref:Uncharacterized protein n=1 Tax=Characodon lateralis TaxID=208331 RepID=A0ABU7D4H3_9TELE|nr:hypothetical protein [Characodon lateralis]
MNHSQGHEGYSLTRGPQTSMSSAISSILSRRTLRPSQSSHKILDPALDVLPGLNHLSRRMSRCPHQMEMYAEDKGLYPELFILFSTLSTSMEMLPKSNDLIARLEKLWEPTENQVIYSFLAKDHRLGLKGTNVLPNLFSPSSKQS